MAMNCTGSVTATAHGSMRWMASTNSSRRPGLASTPAASPARISKGTASAAQRLAGLADLAGGASV
ncbi:hypothetical protein [Novosphingobium sp.]|uniref:hypothetical protein n=1 Tax=Novosphingobium sp. TaxID=1874826 RepID=UPI0031CE7797